MRLALITVLILHACLAGCTSTDGSEHLDDLRSSLRGGFGSNSDTYGTNRRPDVYGASTAPSLPSIGTPGLGK